MNVCSRAIENKSRILINRLTRELYNIWNKFWGIRFGIRKSKCLSKYLMVPAHIIFIACCYSYILFSICYRTGNPNPNKTKKNYITNRRNKYIYYDNLPFTLKSILKMCLLDSFIYFTLLLVYSYQLKYFCQLV